jgi:hypothetical protein
VGHPPNHEDLQKGQSLQISFFPPLPSESVMVGKDEQWGYAAFGLMAGILMGMFAGFGDYWNRHRNLQSRIQNQQ